MYALCCKVKIFFYFVLICYHIADFAFDLHTFFVLLREHKFSGVSISESEEHTIQILFGLSCITGAIFSFVMIGTYAYYFYYHCYCMNNAGYDLVHYSSGDAWFSPDHRCDKKCNRTFVNLELRTSVLELLFKDDIQSGILFWVYNGSQSSAASNPGWMSIAFSVCSIIAHLKLCLCFLTKLCGCGAGEERCGEDCEDAVKKAISCIFGFGGSAICLFLTAVAFVNELN